MKIKEVNLGFYSDATVSLKTSIYNLKLYNIGNSKLINIIYSIASIRNVIELDTEFISK